MPRTRAFLTIAAALLVAVGCGGTDPAVPAGIDDVAEPATVAGTTTDATPRSVLPRPEVLADLATIELHEPPIVDAGPVPVFAWASVADASTYRLTVLGPDGPRWGWEGPETTVRYGAVAEAQRGPVIVPGSWWSVAAIAADGDLVAASDLRPVSPTGDPGPDPAWVAGAAATPADAAAGAPASPDDPAEPTGPVTTETVQPCSLLTTAQLVEIIGEGWSEPEESLYPNGKGGSCTWTYEPSEFGGGVAVSVARADAYNPAGWEGEFDPLLDGIGEEAYLTRSGMDRKVGFRRGEVSVLLSFDYGEVDFERYAAIARLVDEALTR